MKKPEILAPGGSIESIYSAVNAGCDAIYAGGKRFGARAFADNQDNDSLMEIMDRLHLAGRKLYMTVNTILTENEMGQLYDYLAPLYENGLDAVIVQDLGVMSFIHDNFHELPIHASTQMSITGGKATELLKDYGVTRIVPARELSIVELETLRKDTDMEIEVFVHGALCSSFSGQCLMSSLIGGRSGNRGACAGPCRKRYSLNGDDPGYVLSLKDLCALPLLPELIRCGIDSFKIEGRMKKPEYTALVTHIYRKYVDIYCDKGEETFRNVLESSEYREDIKALKDIYNRGGFTMGYLTGNMDAGTMLSGNRPNHEGIRLGEVQAVDSRKHAVNVRYSEQVKKGDIIEIRNESGDKLHDYTMGHDVCKGNAERINTGYNYSKMRKGLPVYRVRNNSLIDKLLSDYPVNMNGVGISGILSARLGKPLELAVKIDGKEDYYTVYGNEVTAADKHPADEAYIRSKVMVSGDSPYTWSNLDIILDEGVYLQPAELKNIRRRALAEYTEQYLEQHYRRCRCFMDEGRRGNDEQESKRNICQQTGNNQKGSQRLIVEVYNRDQLEILVNSDLINDIDILYVHVPSKTADNCKTAGTDNCGTDKCSNDITPYDIAELSVPFYLVMPRIIRQSGIYDIYKEMIKQLAGSNVHFRGIVVCTLEQLARFNYIHDEYNLDIISYYNLYTRNHYAADWLVNNGVTEVMTDVEMTDREIDHIDSLTERSYNMSVLIYGKPSAMITAWTPGECGKLEDGYNNLYSVIGRGEYNDIINYEPVDRIESSRLYKNLSKWVLFTDEDADDIMGIMRKIIRCS